MKLDQFQPVKGEDGAASRESCDCLHCNMEEPVPESRSRLFDIDAWLREEARAERAEAERDALQEQVERQREALRAAENLIGCVDWEEGVVNAQDRDEIAEEIASWESALAATEEVTHES